MKLGVNGWRIHGQRTGVGRYLLNVVRHWTPERVAGRFETIHFYTPHRIDRQDIPLPENIRERVLESNWPMLVWENLRMAPVADDHVIFCPSFSRPLLARGRTVVVTHEAILHKHPELFPRSARVFYDRLYGWSARHATLVITESEAARQDIARCYGVPPAKIRVIYLAPAEFFRVLPPDERVRHAQERYLGSTAPFFLFVGKLSGRRNIPRLLEAFAEFKRQTRRPHKLLIISSQVPSPHLTALGNELDLAEQWAQCPYVSDEDLNLLYNAAEGFVMPSIYETSSLPVMEAQATRTPVICIDTPGNREITGGTALLIPQMEVPEMVEAMIRLAGDISLRRELSEKGLANVQRFSWSRCSAETLAVLEEAARMRSSSTSKTSSPI